MITATQFRDWLKINLVDYGDWCGVGKMDTTKDKAICIYPSKSREKPTNVFGNAGHQSRNFQVVLRWGNILDSAETKALEVHKLLMNKVSTISDSKFCSLVLNNEPVFLGTDEKGIYEYSFDVKIYFEIK